MQENEFLFCFRRNAADEDTGDELAEHRRNADPLNDISAEPGGEKDDADLQGEQHHFRAQLKIPAHANLIRFQRLISAKNTRRGQQTRDHQKQSLVFHRG